VNVDNLHPWLHEKALKSTKYYLFSGGGTVLKAIEDGDPFALSTVEADLFGKNALTIGGCIILLEFT
jgi:hypothetical protein